MKKRHDVLQKALAVIRYDNVAECFQKKKTVHADLLLMWMREGFQNKKVAPCADYQIVIARIEPGQKSRPHFHEVGASSFVEIMGADLGFFAPADVLYRFGRLTFHGTAVSEGATHLGGDRILNIFPYQVHQFENRGEKPAHILIVTHPPIYVGEDEEDIYFFPFYSEK